MIVTSLTMGFSQSETTRGQHVRLRYLNGGRLNLVPVTRQCGDVIYDVILQNSLEIVKE